MFAMLNFKSSAALTVVTWQMYFNVFPKTKVIPFTYGRRWFTGQSLRANTFPTRNGVQRSYRKCHLIPSNIHGLGLNCHVAYTTLGVFNERKYGKFIALTYKCFFEPCSSTEAPSLASSSLAVDRGKPLNENRGESWFHADWVAK